MKKNLKKVLAISILSMGVLSSAPSALCAPGGKKKLERNYGFIFAQYLNESDLRKFPMICKKFGTIVPKLKKNPLTVTLPEYMMKTLLPDMETFEDHHNIINDKDKDRNKHINSFYGNVKVLKYYPQSFDYERYWNIMKLNNVEYLNDFEPEKDADGVSIILKGNEWSCKISPFSGTSYCVEYIKHHEGTTDLEKEDQQKKIVFFFSPFGVFRRGSGHNFIDYYNTFVSKCDLEKFISIDTEDSNILKKITVPGTTAGIEDETCNVCKSLEEVDISNGVKSVGEYAFNKCVSLKRVNIPSSVNKIGTGAFCDCKSLKEVNISEEGKESTSIGSIGENAFKGCMSLRKIKIPENVKQIGPRAFSECTSLEEINIPKGVKLIDGCVFNNCRSLKEISIPDSVQKIGSYAFEGCESLKEVKIPNGVTKIDYSTFSYCRDLKKVEIPNSVKIIDADAFNHCFNLEEVKIPNGVTCIEPTTFSCCINLKKVEIPNSVQKIKYGAFSNCNSLEEIRIPNYAIVDINAFNGCSSLKTIRYNYRVFKDVASFKRYLGF